MMEIILFDGLVFNNFTGKILDEQSNSNGYYVELSKTTLSLLEDIDKDRLKFVEPLKRMISELPDEERNVLKEIIHIANIPDESTDFYIFAELHDFGYDNEYTGQYDRLIYVINGKINEYKKRRQTMNKTKLPLIFSIAGALGVIATGALASCATIKAVKLLEGEDKQLKDISFDKEAIQKSWKSYILPASVATASVVSIFVANGVNRNMLVTLASGLAAMSESYRYYRNRVMDKAPETDTEIVEEMSKGDFITPDGHNFGEVVTFYDPISDRLFERTWVELGDAFYHLNRNFALRGYAYTNELYHFLGLDYTDEGDIYGWYGDWFWEDGLVPWIDYGTHLETHDGKEVYNIIFTWPEQNLHGTDYEFPTIHEPSYFVAPF